MSLLGGMSILYAWIGPMSEEIKKQEINITSEFKKVSYDLDSLFNEEEKSFKEVENIQQKIKSFKDNLASKYGENK